MVDERPFDVEAFAAGYLSCAAWLALGDDGEEVTSLLDVDAWHGELALAGIDYRDGELVAAQLLSHVDGETLARLLEDVTAFARDERDDLVAAVDAGRDAESLGHDFYLSRCGHGTGFWDRGLGDIGRRLHAASQPYGDQQLVAYRDGDGWSFDVW